MISQTSKDMKNMSTKKKDRMLEAGTLAGGITKKVKLIRAQGGCLGTKSR